MMKTSPALPGGASRYITRRSPLEGYRVAIYDSQLGVDIAHCADGELAEKMKEILNGRSSTEAR